MKPYSHFLEDNRIAIFLFHGVIHEQRHPIRNYTHKHLTLDRFVSILRDLRTHGSPISMQDLVAASANGHRLPHRSFAVTFDDGFANNHTVAAPVLTDLEIPATFYVTTDFIDSNSSSWIDRIEYAFEMSRDIRLSAPFSSRPETYRTPQEKLQLLERIRAFVKRSPTLDPYEFADGIWGQLGIKTMEPDKELDQKMDWAQLRELSRHRLFAVGGHGHTHRVLAHLGESALDREISLSLQMLKANLGISVEHYSYPEGLSDCYSDRVIQRLKREGIVCAPSAEPGTNCLGDDLFRLKRVMVT